MTVPETIRTHTYSVLHNGCDPLEADAAKVRHQLQDVLGLVAASPEQADVLVYLGCTFSHQKEQQFEQALVRICTPSNGRLVIASGCYLKESLPHLNLKFSPKEKIVALVAQTLGLQLPSPAIQTSWARAGNGIVVISEGCYGQCAFCSVRLARGQHRSRPLDDVMGDIHRTWDGKAIIKLAGQDVAAYGRDRRATLWELLRAIGHRFPHLQVELGPLGPQWLIKTELGDLALLASQSVVGNVHVPLQSASNAVLKRMKRKYTYKQFEALWVSMDRVGVKNLSTDIMAGFPGETLEDHERSLEFLRTHRLAFAQIFMYEPRPGTTASQCEALPKRIRMERTMELVAEYLRASAEFRGTGLDRLVSSSQGMLFNTNVQFEEDTVDES